jgi:hypothetical protein
VQFTVLHNLLTGPGIAAHKGDTLDESALQGVDIERLIGLGAIAQTADDTAGVMMAAEPESVIEVAPEVVKPRANKPAHKRKPKSK